MAHEFKSTVFFNEVDKGGVVYFANYLKYLDNARTTMFNEMGNGFSVQEEEGKIFAVVSVNIRYRKSLKLDDTFVVKTKFKEIGAVALELSQEIWRNNELTTTAEMKMALLDFKNGQRPISIPESLKLKFLNY